MMRLYRRLGRGSLVILALFLASSGALRLGQGVGAALALSPDAVVQPETTQCEPTPAALAKALMQRETQVSLQEVALKDRQAALALANAAIDRRLQELEAAEAQLTAVIALADGAAEDDLAKLTAVYEAMKPKEAATLFAAMAPEFAAGFLGRMRPESAAAVMAGLSPEAAYAISVLLAGRNANAPKE